MKKHSCILSYSILGVCYLEVLLWITILLSSCATASATPEDVSYIARETGNLKQTVVFDLSDSLPAIDLSGGQLHQSQEYLASQRLFQLSDEGSPPLANRPQQTLSFLPVLKGVPAPFAGINALSDLASAF